MEESKDNLLGAGKLSVLALFTAPVLEYHSVIIG